MLLLKMLNLEKVTQWSWVNRKLYLVTLAGSNGNAISRGAVVRGRGQWWYPVCKIHSGSGVDSWVRCLAMMPVVTSSDTSLASLGNTRFLYLTLLSFWLCELLLTYQCIWYLHISHRVSFYCLQHKISTNTTGLECNPETSIFNSLSKWF